MWQINVIVNSILLLLISFSLISCKGSTTTANQSEEINSNGDYLHKAEKSQEIISESRSPIIEIWQELDGSVAIRGKSLYFKMYDDGTVEFEYELGKRTYTDGTVEFEYEPRKEPIIPPRHTKSFEASVVKIPSHKISEEDFSKFKSMLEELTKTKNIKQEYKPVGLIFDVTVKLTILLKENDTTQKKIIINNSALDVIDESLKKEFPNLLVNLIKEIHLMRVKLRENGENL